MITLRISVRELYWAAGFIEGEGTFYFDKRVCSIRVPQTIKEPLDRLQNLFGGEIYFRKRNQPTHSDQYVFRLNGRLAAAVSMMLLPLMTKKRQEQIRVMLYRWREYTGVVRTGCKKGHDYATSPCKITWRLNGQSHKITRYRQCLICYRLRTGYAGKA